MNIGYNENVGPIISTYVNHGVELYGTPVMANQDTRHRYTRALYPTGSSRVVKGTQETSGSGLLRRVMHAVTSLSVWSDHRNPRRHAR